MTSGQLFSGQVAATTGIVFAILVLLYALVARSRRHNRAIIDASSQNVEEDKIVYYIPKKKFLLDRGRRKGPMPPRAQLPAPGSRDKRPAVKRITRGNGYQYPPLPDREGTE